MKVLFDNNVPVYLLAALPGHEVTTAHRQGWHQLSNGNLLAVAEASGFNLLVTMDRGFRHQQNMQHRTISAALLEPEDQSSMAMQAVGQQLSNDMTEIRPGTVVVIRSKKHSG